MSDCDARCGRAVLLRPYRARRGRQAWRSRDRGISNEDEQSAESVYVPMGNQEKGEGL